MSKKNILVVGGAGFIGSHVAQMLHLAGYHPVIFDNLSTGCRDAISCGTFIKGDLANFNDLKEVFYAFKFDAVMHFAALIDVGESVTNPIKYYINNVSNTLKLLEVMQQFKVDTFIFSSTAAVYGIPQEQRLHENHPLNPINPYGRSKLMVEEILQDLHNAYGLKFCSLRYFNAAGGDPSGKIKNHKQKESNLIPIILRSLLNPKGSIILYGTDYPTLDGTCIRDYIHIDDLGSAHILAMKKLLDGFSSSIYNLGNGNGFSVREVIRAAEHVTGLKVNVIEGPRRAGDPPILVADASKAHRELKWTPRFADLESMIAHAWQALKKG